jgi:hypothetical protein
VVILGSHFRGKKCGQTQGQETNLSLICRTSRFILSSNEKLYVTFAHLLVQKGIFLELALCEHAWKSFVSEPFSFICLTSASLAHSRTFYGKDMSQKNEDLFDKQQRLCRCHYVISL